MSRPLRLDHAGAIWHVTSRGNEKQAIFLDDRDRRQFLGGLARVVEACRWQVHAYVLMGNHYHLLFETPEPTLSRGMQRLNGSYTQKFNWRHERVGHLFQGRFRSILVERESHLLELIRYVVLNPVRAGLVQDVADWRWSSYRATAGIAPAPEWLEVSWTLAQFGKGAASRVGYRGFVAQARRSGHAPWKALAGQIFLGGDEFLERVRRMIALTPRSAEIPTSQRTPTRPSLAAILAAATKEFSVSADELTRRRSSAARLAVAYVARTDALLALARFSACLGVGASAASHLALQAERRMGENARFRARVERLRAAVWKIQT